MDNTLDYFKNLSSNSKTKYIALCILVVYISSDSKTGNLLAFFVILFLLFVLSSLDQTNTNGINEKITRDLESLYDFSDNKNIKYQTNVSSFLDLNPYSYNSPPDFFYLDANLITAYSDLKTHFFEYNPEAYLQSTRAANRLLNIKKDFETVISEDPIVPNLKDNYAKTYELTHSNETGVIKNKYPMFLIAEQEYKKALNHISSFMKTCPSVPVIHLKLNDLTLKINLLLKRNLDVIYTIYKREKNNGDPWITDYDNPKAYNKVAGDTVIENTFKVY
jgi:hypothetical protein